MASGQGCEDPRALRRQPDPHHPVVFGIPLAAHEARRLGAVHELDGTVVLQEQVAGHLADGRRVRLRVTPYRQEELVLGRREPC